MYFAHLTSQSTPIENPGAGFFSTYGPLVLEHILAPIILSLCGCLGALLKFIIADKLLVVKEIKKSTDPDIEQFSELYKKRIDESLRIGVEKILHYIGKNKNNVIEHHLYVCKKINKTVGFIKFMVSKEHKYIFVAYVAVDNTDSVANKFGLKIMAKKLAKKYFRPNIANCVIMEAKPLKGRGYKTAFNLRVARYAKMLKKRCYCVDFPYIQPKMPDDFDAMLEEDFLPLLYIPFYEKENNCISKDELLALIQSIYLEIYSPSCDPNSGHDCAAYNNYLTTIMDLYKDDSKKYINLVPLN